jgi:hypothetical protein
MMDVEPVQVACKWLAAHWNLPVRALGEIRLSRGIL